MENGRGLRIGGARGAPAAVLIGALWACSAWGAEDITFENRLVRLTIATDGRAKALVDKPAGRQWLAANPGSLSFVKRGGAFHNATKIARDGEELRVAYGRSGVTARFRVAVRPRYFVVRLLEVSGEGIEELCLAQLRTRITESVGWWLNVRWNDEFAVCLMGLSERVNTGGLRALVYPEFGMKGEAVAIIAAPKGRLLDVIQEVERDCKLPTATLGGHWAKRSPDVRRGYLFTDLTEANADETIRYARLGEFAYVMTYSGTWSTSLGSYPINRANFPRGEASLKATVDKLHAAKLKAGLHMLTSFVGKNDPLVRPVPDRRLLTDAATSLARDVDDKAAELLVTDVPEGFPRRAAYYGASRQGFDLLVDREIIRYGRVGGAEGRSLLQCTRGAHGTRPARHAAGAKVRHLTERYGCYLADLRTSLKDELADRVAGVVNRCGFDMIYFDGGECNGANGPYWYWVTPQQMAIWKRFRRDVLVQGSGGTPWTWHVFCRGACDDFAAVAPKQYLDWHKIRDSWQHYTRSFMPAELGWWGFLADAPHHPATSPDEVECYAARMLETNLAALKKNGRTKELLELLGRWERLRLSGSVPASVREKLHSGEWHLAEIDGKPALLPVRYDTRRLDTGQTVAMTNAFAAQPLGFRLQAVPTLAAPGDKANVLLLGSDVALPVPTPNAKAPMPGALVGRVDLTKTGRGRLEGLALPADAPPPAGHAGKPANLLKHRALAVRLRVEAPAPPPGRPPAVLNVQLESTAQRYRDHYVDLDFTGARTIVLPEPTTQRMLPEFRPAHAAYPFKQAMYGYDYGRIVAVNFRWMRRPKDRSVRCAVERVEALAESQTLLSSPEIAVGDARIRLPVDLKTGHYAECWAGGSVRVFDADGAPLKSVDPAAAAPRVPAGEYKLRLSARRPASAKLTVITLGRPLRW
jgi:hypothetical protein